MARKYGKRRAGSRGLRAALLRELEAKDVPLRAFILGHGWGESFYVSVHRWLTRRRDRRNGRVYSLPLGHRIVLAGVLGYEGPVLTKAERDLVAAFRPKATSGK